jgi:hypothetical protein
LRNLCLLAALLAGLFACGCGSSFRVQTSDYDDIQQTELGPDAFVERYGEADVWKNEKVGGDLQITAIWRCVNGEYREMVWRTQQREAGPQYWHLVKDVTRKGECE